MSDYVCEKCAQSWLFLGKPPYGTFSDDFLRAAMNGHIECIDRLLGAGLEKNPYTIMYAIDYGHTICAKWLIDKGFPRCGREIAAAASHGYNNVIRWLIDMGFEKSFGAIEKAAAGNHTDTVEFLIGEGGFTDCYAAGVQRFMRRGDRRFVRRGDQRVTLAGIESAIGHKNLYCAQLLLELGCPQTRYAYSCAIKAGSIECLQWLHNNGFPKDDLLTWQAAALGSLKILVWLIDNNFPVDEHSVIQGAATSWPYRGDFIHCNNDCVHFLIGRGFPVKQHLINRITKIVNKHKRYANELMSVNPTIPRDIKNLVAERYALSML